jgi:dipeptidyl aminopeptidase/acylaminoacyl peptidase
VFTSNWVQFEDPFSPVGFGENPDEVFHLVWQSGTWGVKAMDLRHDLADREVYFNPRVDVTQVTKLGAYPRVVDLAYYEDGPQRFIVDSRVAAVHDLAQAELPDDTIEIVDESWDQRTYLVRARRPGNAGDFYRVDMESHDIENVGAEYSHLSGIGLAPTKTIEITDAAGGSFSAHLTLPPNAKGPVPAVIMPRAAASNLDLESPNYLVQFLAYSGYAVLRVNQRGPKDYGESWRQDKAVIGWKEAADDIHTAIDYLVREGIAKSGSTCALGRNVGAYTALIAAIEHPDDVRCVVSISGTVNPRFFLGSLPPNVSRVINDASPVVRAKEIQAPVLLFDGTKARQTVDFETTLRHANKDVRLVEYDYVSPDYSQAPYRMDMLTRIGEFLQEQTGQGG